MDSFIVSDIEVLLNLSRTLIKNWSMGRPLKITPSIREATGTGTNNLYSLHDVYLMAIASELHKAGMLTHVIQLVLDKLPNTLFTENVSSGIVVNIAEGEADIMAINSDVESIPLNIKRGRNWGVVQYYIDISMLINNVNERIKEFKSRQKWDGKQKARAMVRQRRP